MTTANLKMNAENQTSMPEHPCWDGEAPTTAVMLQHITIAGYIFLPLCSILASVCMVIFFLEVSFLNKHYRNLLSRRRKTLNVLFVYPMFAVTSLMVLWVPRSVVLMELVSSSFFSLALYNFLHLIPDYYGGRQKMIKQLGGKEVSLRKPPCCCWPCCACLPKAKFSGQFYLNIKIVVLQFAIVKPTLNFAAAVMWTNGSYNPGSGDPQSPTLYMQIIVTISTLIAVFGMMVIMGIAAPNLPEFHIKPKFFSIQLVLITTTLVGLIINIIASNEVISCVPPFSSKTRASQITHTIYVLEMVPLSILGRIFYLRKVEYENPDEENLQDLQGTDMQNMASGENGQAILGANDVISTQPITVVSGVGPTVDNQSEV